MPDLVLPPDYIRDAAIGKVTNVTRRVEIYESDATTVWRANPGIISGAVSADLDRSERRTLSLTLDNTTKELRSGPGELWYDKVIKVYRGIDVPGVGSWERQLGEFVIDTIGEANFPNVVDITARDRTKYLMKAKFAATTLFAQNTPIENVVRAIAVSGGVPIEKIDLPLTGVSTYRDFAFDAAAERWASIKELCTAHNYDVFFDNLGVLRMQEYSDPALDLPDFVFRTGSPFGNLVSFKKSSNDSRLYNHVIVVGRQVEGALEVRGEAKNEDPVSPTRVAAIGLRTAPEFKSDFISSNTQAEVLAQSMLYRYQLESFELNLESVVIPWMEPGIVAQFLDPDPNISEPTNFLLTSFTIPLELRPMSAVAKRILPRS